MKRPRVGVVGARRRRQGLGPFVVRELVAAGAEVPCFLATSEATRDEAERNLASLCPDGPRGHLDLDAMIEAENLDALAILSPAETHETFLDAALAAGLHALCEKPFVWGGPAPARSAARIADGFAARGLLLHEVCQWPYTLAAYEHLHPGALSKAPERFEMELQPAARGVDGVAQSLPHALSLLQALSPGDAPRIENPTWSTTDPKADVLSIAFSYRTRDTTTRALVTLTPTDRHPRACAIAIDGRRAERRVSGEAYRLSFVAEDGRSEPLGDPLAPLVADFVRALSHPTDASASALRRRIVERMTLLDDLVTDYARLAGMA